jgi:DNA-binding NarL/FixJ family response regulator
MPGTDAAKRTAIPESTTTLREWLGFFGCAVFFFFFGYNYDEFLNADRSWYAAVFFLTLAAGMILFGSKFSNAPEKLSKIASFTAPAAILTSALMALCPEPLQLVLYCLSAALMSPVIVRRCYGILRAAPAGRKLTLYLSVICATVILHSFWVMLPWPIQIRFLIPAMMILPAWLGVRRSVPVVKEPIVPVSFQFSKQLIPVIIAFILLFFMDVSSSVIHTFIVATGYQGAAPLYWFAGTILPVIAFVIYAVLSDIGREKAAFIAGMLLFLAGLYLALLPGDTVGSLLVPLFIADGLGGSFAEFFILTMPVIFLAGTGRPVLMASLGLAFDLLSCALLWVGPYWIPPVFVETLGAPTLVAAALFAIGFFAIALYLFERRKETTLAAAINGLILTPLAPHEIKEQVVDLQDQDEAATADRALLAAGFLPVERKVAALLIEGFTKGEIAHKLHLTAAEVSDSLGEIRIKVTGASEDKEAELFAAAAEAYSLTAREIQVLRGIYEGKTNNEIAAQHFISDATVKYHVKNLMKKIPVDGRYQVRDWILSYASK